MDARSAVTPRTVKNGEGPDRAGVPCLREAINAYRAEQKGELDKEVRGLLARLADSSDAAKAFERLMKERRPPRVISPPRSNYDPQRKAAELLTICIQADGWARTFRLEIAKAETALARMRRHGEALGRLRELVPDVAARDLPPSCALSVFEPPSSVPALEDAFDLIARWIDWRSGIAKSAVARIGATRKMRTKNAAENAAIWCLGAQVRTVVGWPRWPEVADLAQVVLGTKVKVSEERVRNVVRKGAGMYADMIGNQTRRYFATKIADARRRQPSGALGRQKSD